MLLTGMNPMKSGRETGRIVRNQTSDLPILHTIWTSLEPNFFKN